MKSGIMFANAGPLGQPATLEMLARTGEEVGVEPLWTVEHAVDADGLRSRLHDFADRVLAKL